ncbi:MAG: aspartate aminotransferase family protein [Opitutaceae bacterium]|jgi:4-aminobutyrate aminotransferase-like enzyme|nr:aspartate aminotransferase family protein [Opitutaceae bacterium]
MSTTPILNLNRFDASAPGLDAATLRMVRRREAAFGPNSVLFYKKPIVVASASGAWMTDTDGNRYLDLYNNVPCVGHSNQHVANAICNQSRILSTNTRYLYETIHDYAEKLLATFPNPLRNITFTCTGSEANDLALQIVRACTGGEGIIITENAYHGNTTAVAACSPSAWRTGAPPPANIRRVPAPERFRSADPDPGATFSKNIELAINDFRANGLKPAALLVDTYFTSDGLLDGPAGFLAPAFETARKHGLLVIGDEVQPGFGRTGVMWNFLRHNAIPDLVTLGKPMGNGFPMGGVVVRPDLLDRFTREISYFNTFGGNALAGATGLAVLEELQGRQLVANAAKTGAYLKKRLAELAKQHPCIGDVRGAGLFVGVEFVKTQDKLPQWDGRQPDAAIVTRLVNRLKELGVLIGASGPFANVIRARPPLCLTETEADFFVGKLAQALDETN